MTQVKLLALLNAFKADDIARLKDIINNRVSSCKKPSGANYTITKDDIERAEKTIVGHAKSWKKEDLVKTRQSMDGRNNFPDMTELFAG